MAYILILINPILNFLCLIFFGRFIGRKGSIILTIFHLVLAWFSCFSVLLYALKYNDICYFFFYKWIDTGVLTISFNFLFDSLSIIMLFLIISISTIVHFYSIDYMKSDPHLQRFLSFLSLFTFFMILLVTSENFVQLFLGWEGVGICSYLLISFWYNRLDACKSAVKAVIFNKFGDCSLLIAISFIFYFVKSLNFAIVFSFFNNLYFDFLFFNHSVLDVISFFLLIAAVGKSAQFFLHLWLADAMEGPTPVSALIHAATMVTAGIFLIIRCSFLIALSPGIIFVMSLIGCLTIIFSSTTGFVQYDVKKIIAYSTCSQLGYMLISCSFLNYKIALFHLFNHGFFKALLFLSAGLLIHNFLDEQDLRKMGGLVNILPLTYLFFLGGSLSLMGFPFLTGFYSKDVLIEYQYLVSSTFNEGILVFHICSFCAFLTGFYSIRLIYYCFLSSPSGNKFSYKSVYGFESDYFSIFFLSLLFFLSISAGYLFSDIFIGLGSNFFEGSVCNYIFNCNLGTLKKYNEFLIVFPVKIIPLFYTLFSIYAYLQLIWFNNFLSFYLMFTRLPYNLFIFFNSGWLINYFNMLITDFFFKIGFFFFFFW